MENKKSIFDLNEIQKQAVEELKVLETTINSMLEGFRVKYKGEANYDIKIEDYGLYDGNSIILSPTTRVHLGIDTGIVPLGTSEK